MDNYYKRNKERLKNKELQKYYENKNKVLEAYETKETANMLLTLVYFDTEKEYKTAIMTAITNDDMETIALRGLAGYTYGNGTQWRKLLKRYGCAITEGKWFILYKRNKSKNDNK